MTDRPLDFGLSHDGPVMFLTLFSPDGMNRLTRSKVTALRDEVENLAVTEPGVPAMPLVISGEGVFSVGADLNEIAHLSGAEAVEFAKLGQALMRVIDLYPANVYAAIAGYCMGGGLDLALACDYRIAHPHAVFGHRGAALGLITGWGGTQRLPRLVGKARALQMLIAAEKVPAPEALRMGLVDKLAEDPVREAYAMALQWATKPQRAAAIARLLPLM